MLCPYEERHGGEAGFVAPIGPIRYIEMNEVGIPK